MHEALEGIKVLDLAAMGPGAYCTKIIADMGAEVIRIQEIGSSGGRRGGRRWTIPFYAYGMRRNTKVLGLNLKSPEGKEVFNGLVRKADVVVVGLRPQAGQRLGIDYETLRSVNPRIIYCSLTGYGADGPYRDYAGHDINYQSLGGIVGMTGPGDHLPSIPGATVSDSAGGGMHAAIAILMAIIARYKTGEGQFVDVSATDGVVAMMGTVIDEYLSAGVEPRRGETLLTGQYPWYKIYETKDGKYVSVGAIEPWFYENLCRLMGLEDLAEHQYAEGEKRDEIFTRFRDTFRSKTRDEWVEILMAADTCVTPVYSVADLCADPHFIQRGMVIEVEHPEKGMVKQAGIMTKLSATPGIIKNVDPKLGEFTDSILGEIGYSTARINELRELGVIE